MRFTRARLLSLPRTSATSSLCHVCAMTFAMFGSTTIHRTHTDYELWPTVRLNTIGEGFFLNVDHDDNTTSLMSDIPLQLPATAHGPSNVCSNVLTNWERSRATVHSLQPAPHQTGVNPWQSRCTPKTWTHNSWSLKSCSICHTASTRTL